MPAKKKTAKPKQIATHTHPAATRKNIPSAEMQQVIGDDIKAPVAVKYPRNAPPISPETEDRNADLDPQLIWRGKSVTSLEVQAPPLFIQEKIHPKALIDDLLRQSKVRSKAEAIDSGQDTPDLFADFNGLPPEAKSTDFYQHDGHWQNRMILGDSMQVMASLAEREGLRGKVQCIYFDPPYGIKFNSNFQWSTTSRDVKDGKADHITREPEQVKAFRDTWRDGIHSYLTYLRDRLTVARDLLTDSGSIFVQIGDENVHRVRMLMDEVFGDGNFGAIITVRKTTSDSTAILGSTCDFVIWYAKNIVLVKARMLLAKRGEEGESRYINSYFDGRAYRDDNITSSRPAGDGDVKKIDLYGKTFTPGAGTFKTTADSLRRLAKADRLTISGRGKLNYRRFNNDYGYMPHANLWNDISGAVQSRSDPKIYVVQTSASIIERCILMATDPGDLVLDPTCGSGTTATVAEQWGRRWITIDTSRVALALARARLMGARYPYYLLADSREGQLKEAEITRSAPRTEPVHGHMAHGFVYERVPHIMLKSIANNAEIDVIWDKFQQVLEPLREKLNKTLGTKWEEWEIPRQLEPKAAGTAALQIHTDWWSQRIARQKEIDASISAKADSEFLYDKPYQDNKKVRVAGPFTVESVSPHRFLSVDENDEVVDGWKVKENASPYDKQQDFATVMLENLKTAGVQQAHKEDRLTFSSVVPFPGTKMICGEGRYTEGESEDAPLKRAGIFIGPEFGTVSRPDLVEAAREAADLNFDVLIACAFNYDAHSSEFEKLGKIPVLKARMNADLHMAQDLKNTGKGNLFVIFGEPDIELKTDGDNVTVRIRGVDVFKPQTGEVVSSGPEGIACWFVDTDYNEESFFVRHAYFLGQNDPYKALKTTLKAEIDPEAWESLNRDTSRPFPKPTSGRIAVKVINHLGDEVMKVFSV